MKKLVIVDTGAMARDVTAFANLYGLCEIVGYTCSNEYVKSSKKDHSEWNICALNELEQRYDKNDIELFVATPPFWMLNRVWRDTFNAMKQRGFRFATLTSPTATALSEHVGEGCCIENFAYLPTETKVGLNTLIDIFVNIAHYFKIGNYCSGGIRTIILGKVKIGDQCFVGVASTIFENVKIGHKYLTGGTTTIKKMCHSVSNVSFPLMG